MAAGDPMIPPPPGGGRPAAPRRPPEVAGTAEDEPARLRDLEASYRALFEHSPEMMASVSAPRGLILECNRALAARVGESREALVGRPIAEMFAHGADSAAAPVLQTWSTGESVDQVVLDLRVCGGGVIPVLLSARPVRSAPGEVVRAYYTLREASALRRATLLESVIEGSPDAVLAVDPAGAIVVVNAAAERLFLYPREELLGAPLELLLPEALAARHVELRQRFLRAPARRSMGAGVEVAARRKDGSTVPVDVGLGVAQGLDGQLVVATVVDASARKQAEALAAVRDRELARSNAELEQFAYVASHDLQEPLRMVASYTELLAERYAGQLDERADKYIRYASEGARRMQQLINDLLAYARVGSRRREPAVVDAGLVLSLSLRNLEVAIREAQAVVGSGPLPLLRADAVQLGQVFQNLVGNAIKFRGSEPPRVQVSAERSGDRWRFSVSDNGIGFEMQFAERIFQVFQRLHERDRYPGNGIGLAITRKIVERQGGKVWAESEPGRGATFHFTWPALP